MKPNENLLDVFMFKITIFVNTPSSGIFYNTVVFSNEVFKVFFFLFASRRLWVVFVLCRLN